MYGFGIAGFRSFGPDPQFIAPLGKINLLVGQNNVGKSNVLRALRLLEEVGRSRDGAPPSFDSVLDRHQGKRGASLSLLLPIPTDDDGVDAYLSKIVPPHFTRESQAFRSARSIVKSLPNNSCGATWFSRQIPGSAIQSPQFDKSLIDRNRITGEASYLGVRSTDWYAIWSPIANSTGADLNSHVPDVLKWLNPFNRTAVPEVFAVEAFRQIGKSGTAYQGLNGLGLIARLEELQNPKLSARADRQKFDQINNFLRQVTGCADAQISVPHSADELNVEMGSRVLPIQSLGTGIHEVVILAAAATAQDNAILCLEEPEVHLHPRLQRRLLAYLRDHTTNQYFITTHSAHLLDASGVEKFHLQLNAHGETTVQHLNTPGGRANVCFDLGYRPSDLVQSNCVIWVEGPSDRIYVNAWIKAMSPELAEGEHYSIMFYGGKLLAHLEVSDHEVTEFIELQRLNRRVAIIMDSDKSGPDMQVGVTKLRIEEETKAHGGLAWITTGREIENYAEANGLKAALAKIHPNTRFRRATDQWACVYATSAGERDKVDKLRIARELVDQVNFDVLDLRDRVEELVAFIRESNK